MDDLVRKDMVVNDVIKQYPRTIGVFNRFKIDACCGDARTVAEAASQDGADLDALLGELDAAAREAVTA